MVTKIKRNAIKIPLLMTSCFKMRNAGTYSIVAYDPKKGQMGVAVQSHWFAVGASVAWAEAGVGAVATQSFIEPSYGPSGLALMRSGQSASESLAILLAKDPMRDVRQVAMIDASGGVGAYTGKFCVAEAGHIIRQNFSVQANMMENKNVWPIMEKTYAKSKGDLAERMLLTLEAAEAAGGDIRGRQSAAIIVVSSEATGHYNSDRIFDLRVDDHPQPLDELRRLLNVGRAYEQMNQGDDLFTQGKFLEASRKYEQAAKILPNLMEAKFWQAVTFTAGGMFTEGRAIFSQVFSQEPKWRQMVPRLPNAGILPNDAKLIDDITKIK